MKHPRQNALRWIREAAHTLRVAERVLEQPEAYNVVCFLAEQVAQKALKAVRYFDGARLVSIHSVSELIKEVAQTRPEFLSLQPQGAVLDQYYITTRYPDAVAEPAIPSEIFTKEQAEHALRIARAIFEKCQSLVR
ncbi:MAG: HEPN domain-containing protein [Acidobacteria bacterium]|nr:HEPN domain-containing protein [Acidobacteriota bacterium]